MEKAEEFIPYQEELEDIMLPKEINDFPLQFNANPNAALSKIMTFNDNFSDPYYLGKLLCVTKGLDSRKLTDVMVSSKFQQLPLLYFFFSALNIEFTPIVDAAAVLLSKISFPNSKGKIKVIFTAFCDAYLAKNTSYTLANNNIMSVAIGIVVFSARASSTNIVSPEEFQNYFLKSNLPKENIFLLYNELTQNHMKINYSFADIVEPPNLKKEGQLKRSKSVFSFRRALFLKVKGMWLLTSHDPKFTSIKLKILLFDVMATVTETKEGDFTLDIVSNAGNNLVIQPLKANEGKDSKQYQFYCDSKEELKEWADIINYVSFLGSITSIINPMVEKGQWSPDF